MNVLIKEVLSISADQVLCRVQGLQERLSLRVEEALVQHIPALLSPRIFEFIVGEVILHRYLVLVVVLRPCIKLVLVLLNVLALEGAWEIHHLLLILSLGLFLALFIGFRWGHLEIIILRLQQFIEIDLERVAKWLLQGVSILHHLILRLK